MDPTQPGTTQPAAEIAAYPIPRPAAGDDPRLCLGLAYDVGQVLHRYGFPPVDTGADVARVLHALFALIYQEESR